MGNALKRALPDVAAAAVAVYVCRQQPLHPGAEVVVATGPEHEVEVIGHQTKADQPHRHASTGLTQEPNEAVVVVGIVEDLGPAVAAIEGMVAIATDRGSRCAWHGERGGRQGSQRDGPRQGRALGGEATGIGQKNPECPRLPGKEVNATDPGRAVRLAVKATGMRPKES